MNAVQQIRRFNAGRDPERLALKYRAMRGDAFVFLRATCHLFHERLPLGESVLRKAPAAWTCGDLHLENFGSYKGDNRQVYFDINDFDEALLAPLGWDLVRGLASILVGCRSLGVDRHAVEVPLQLCDVFLDAYGRALADGKARWVERETATGPVGALLQEARLRHRAALLDSRTHPKGRRRLLNTDGRKALPASKAQRDAVQAFFSGFAAQQGDPRFFEVLDVARRIAGTGSLGVERYIVLVRGKGSPDGNYLLDLKHAQPSAPARYVALAQPAWADEAQRVVAIQRRMQAVGMAFLHPVVMDGQPFVLRGLQPSEDRVALVALSVPHLSQLVGVMGQCLAWAQLRSSGRGGSATADALIAFGAKKKWRGRLLDIARHAAAQVQADWEDFSVAYDEGVFAG
ncbi:MAG: DUF2252 domain-containing protein [Pseudomonadota bacterium]